MAFNTTTGRVEYTATSGQTAFPFTFKAYETTDLIVYLTPSGDLPDDATDILVESTDYTVTLDGDNGGEITLLTGATTGDQVTVLRQLPVTRNVDYQTNGDLLADTLDLDQEYQTYLVQDLEASKTRFIKMPNSIQGVDNNLPNPEAQQYLRWNSTGDALENDTTPPVWVQEVQDDRDAVQVLHDTVVAKASEASLSELNSANNASAAATSATSAATSATSAENSATTATTQAGIATTKAEEASVSATVSSNSAGVSALNATSASNSASNASTSASNASTSETNAAASASSAATSATNASNSAASAATSLATFEGQYTSSTTEPSSPNIGELWFDETANIMKVYDGSGFVNAGSSVNGTSSRNTYTATASQTDFAATYDSGYVDVYVNGIKLQDTVDFTATDGTTVVLTSGANAGDIVDIVAYGTFELANHYTKAEVDNAIQVVPLHVKAQVSITKGQAVMYHGYSESEQAVKVKPTINQSDICIGIANSDMDADEIGSIATRGLITDIDTSMYSVGQILYSNGSGGYTTTKPTTAYQAVAYVLRSNATTGSMMVSVNEPVNAIEKVTSTDNAIVRFDGTTGQVQNSLQTINDNGIIEWDSSIEDGIEYFDSGLIGVPDTTFSSTGARIYPDGTIRGKSSYGEYVKYPDGRIIIVGAVTVTTTSAINNRYGSTSGVAYYNGSTVSYPYLLSKITNSSSAISNASAGVAPTHYILPSLSSANIYCYYYRNGGVVSVDYKIQGEYK